MTNTRKVSSATIFKTLIDLGQLPSSEGGKKISKAELQEALDSFGWDGQVTRGEVIAAQRALDGFDAGGKLTADAKALLDEWTKAQTATGGGLSWSRRSEAYRNLESVFRWSAGSAGGATLTPGEARALLAVLGTDPAPARIADAQRLLAEVKRAGQGKRTTLDVIKTWLEKHPMPAAPAGLAAKGGAVAAKLLWPSETDREIALVSFGTAPKKITAADLLNRLGESSTVPVEERTLDDLFAGPTDTGGSTDPGDIARAKDFQTLKDALSSELTDIHVYKIGKLDLDLYVVGRTADGKLAGMVTSVVET